MVYATDGTFNGLLSAVFESYERHELPDTVLSSSCCQIGLDGEIHLVATDEAKAERVMKGIRDRVDEEALEQLYRAYLSEAPDAGNAILRYVRKGMRLGRTILGMLQDPDVFRVVDLNRKVLKETHLFLGILRFSKLHSGVYLALFEPQYDILQLVAAHFTERLSDQPWIIRDLRRGTSAWFDTHDLVFSDVLLPDAGHATDSEADYQALWQRYFKSIAIESRINPKLQMNFMPKRYWKHMTEKRPG